MGRIYKRGKAWYLDYSEAGGRRIQRRASTDKTKALQLLATVEAKTAAVRLGVASPDAEIEDTGLERVREAYIGHLRLHRRPRTAARADMALRAILGALGALRVSQLNPAGIERYQGCRKETVSKRTVNIETGALKAMLTWAVRSRMVRSNPLAQVRPLRQEREERKPRRALRPAEAVALLEAARRHHPRYADLFLCALHTGMRRGELITLKWSDVDFDAHEIAVRGEVAKNHRKRRLPMTPELEARLRAMRADCSPPRPRAGLLVSLARRDRARGTCGTPEALQAEAQALLDRGAELVFRTGLGTPMGNNLNRILAETVALAGVDPRGVDVHALRYTFGSWLMMSGANVKLVARLMGHASVQLTLDIYTDAGIMDWHGAVDKLPALEAEKALSGDARVTAAGKPPQAEAV